ncbi:hypothetical protein [Ruminococcus sp. zg-924]|uniref:hypothetical protein n=1 Tax=Ruminococcus sp. zg-924 TaxID=2678505 RepID=UPI0021088C88|nr:hypothetical protein [Ruminococcus sp. zg-924]MCQ4022844.1 hypothetical protein [Ruminococcus sp. zg-924]
MFETNFDFDYNRFKLNAILGQFGNEEENLRNELINHLDRMYGELVPQEVKDKVEADIVQEQQREWKEQNCFALIHLHDEDDDVFFTARNINSLYDAARLYYDELYDIKDELSLDSLVDRFDYTDYIDEPVFNVLSDAQKNDDRIVCETHFDFEVGTLEMRDKNGVDMYGCDLNYLGVAIDRLEHKLGFSEEDKRNMFNEDIKKYIVQCSSEGQDEGSTMHL